MLVNLRSPTMGETSGSVIRALSLGKPVIVCDVGWFAELPDGVALKVPVDPSGRRRDARGGARRSVASRGTSGDEPRRAAYVERGARPRPVADRYAETLEQAAGGAAVDDAVLACGRAAAAEGRRRSPETGELAEALARGRALAR